MNDLVLLLAGVIASVVTWKLGYDSGKRDERKRIGIHLLRIRQEQATRR